MEERKGENERAVAVVGAGITGLVAAYRLMQAGVPVQVYEATDRVGGVIRSTRSGGYLAEFGPNSILETSIRLRAFLQEVGLGDRMLYSRPEAENRYLVRNGRPMVLPMSPVGFFRCKLFSWRAKWTLLREPFVPARRDGAEESVAEFVLRRLDQEWLDYAINPMIAGIYAGDPKRLSVKYGFPRLYALEQRYGSLLLGQILGARERRRRGEIPKQQAKKISFDEGLEVLPRQLARLLGDRVRLRHEVMEVAYEPEGWRLKIRTPDGMETAVSAAVLFTAPAYRLAEIRLDLGRDRSGLSLRSLGEIEYPPVASVVLGFRREAVAHPLDGFGMLVPEKEPFQILGTLFSSTLFERRAPEGHVTLTSYIGGTRAPERALEPPDRLVEMTYEDLRRLLGVRERPTFTHCVVYRRAIPQYVLGYGRYLELMERMEKEGPGLFFAGHYRDGISLSDSIHSGLRAADRITAFFYKRESSEG